MGLSCPFLAGSVAYLDYKSRRANSRLLVGLEDFVDRVWDKFQHQVEIHLLLLLPGLVKVVLQGYDVGVGEGLHYLLVYVIVVVGKKGRGGGKNVCVVISKSFNLRRTTLKPQHKERETRLLLSS